MLKYFKLRCNYYKWLIHLFFNRTSFLVQTGYLQSIKQDKPVDNDNKPIPWMSYSLINFLKTRLNNKMNVFEYGSGYSTLFFANKVNSVNSIEYNKKWYDKINPLIKQTTNVNLIHIPIGEEYVHGMLHKSVKTKKFDIIIVDGRKRVACSISALKHLSANGVLILDDSNRERYAEIFPYYSKNGYKEITIEGFKPQDLSMGSTTIFYKTNNVLGI